MVCDACHLALNIWLTNLFDVRHWMCVRWKIEQNEQLKFNCNVVWLCVGETRRLERNWNVRIKLLCVHRCVSMYKTEMSKSSIYNVRHGSTPQASIVHLASPIIIIIIKTEKHNINSAIISQINYDFFVFFLIEMNAIWKTHIYLSVCDWFKIEYLLAMIFNRARMQRHNNSCVFTEILRFAPTGIFIRNKVTLVSRKASAEFWTKLCLECAVNANANACTS